MGCSRAFGEIAKSLFREDSEAALALGDRNVERVLALRRGESCPAERIRCFGIPVQAQGPGVSEASTAIDPHARIVPRSGNEGDSTYGTLDDLIG